MHTPRRRRGTAQPAHTVGDAEGARGVGYALSVRKWLAGSARQQFGADVPANVSDTYRAGNSRVGGASPIGIVLGTMPRARMPEVSMTGSGFGGSKAANIHAQRLLQQAPYLREYVHCVRQQ